MLRMKTQNRKTISWDVMSLILWRNFMGKPEPIRNGYSRSVSKRQKIHKTLEVSHYAWLVVSAYPRNH